MAKKDRLHALRRPEIVQLAEAGCIHAEIRAITGQSAEIVAYYRGKAASRVAQNNRK